MADNLQPNNISILDVRNILQHPSLDLGTLCLSDNINIWSRWKPINSSVLTMSEEELKRRNFGLTITKLNPDTFTPTSYYYDRPKGGNSSPYRLGDFRRYTHNAKPFCWISDIVWNMTGQTFDSLYALPNYKYELGSSGQGDISNIQIVAGDLTTTDGSLIPFANLYLGLKCKGKDGLEKWCYSSKKMGDTSGGGVTIQLNNPSYSLGAYLSGNNVAVNEEVELLPFFSNSPTTPSSSVMYNFPTGKYVKFVKTQSFDYSVKIQSVSFTSSMRGSLGGGVTIAQGGEQVVNTVKRPATSGNDENITTTIQFEVINSNAVPVKIKRDNLKIKINNTSLDEATVQELMLMSNQINVTEISIPANTTLVCRCKAQYVPRTSTLYNIPLNTNTSITVGLSYNMVNIPSSTGFKFKIVQD